MNKEEEKLARQAFAEIIYNYKRKEKDDQIEDSIRFMNVMIRKYNIQDTYNTIEDKKRKNIRSCCANTDCFGNCFAPCHFFLRFMKLTFMLMFLTFVLTGLCYIVYYIVNRFK